MDEGVAYEEGVADEHGCIVLGHKEQREDLTTLIAGARQEKGMFVDSNGYRIDPLHDRNIMVIGALFNQGRMFYGKQEEAFEKIADYIKTHVVDHSWHYDLLIGRKLIRQARKTRSQPARGQSWSTSRVFAAIIEHPKMRIDMEKKQLGALFWVYPDALLSRFGHEVSTKNSPSRHYTISISARATICISLPTPCSMTRGTRPTAMSLNR